MSKTKRPVGRPKIEFDESQLQLLEKLAGLHCSLEEMSSVMKCSVDTLSNNFSEAIKRGRDQGKVSLKRKQYEVAMQGNVSMLIWLGKQHLGQTEKVESKIENETTIKSEKDETITRLLAMFNDKKG